MWYLVKDVMSAGQCWSCEEMLYATQVNYFVMQSDAYSMPWL